MELSSVQGYVRDRAGAEVAPGFSRGVDGKKVYIGGPVCRLPRPLTRRMECRYLIGESERLSVWEEAEERVREKGDPQELRLMSRASYDMPRWLLSMVPPMRVETGYRRNGLQRVLHGAAILGSCVSGGEIKLGAIGVGGRSVVRPVGFSFHGSEIERLREFGTEARLSRMSSIVRTAIFVGLAMPGAREGVVGPAPHLWESEGWDKEGVGFAFRNVTTLSVSFCETLMELSGCMSYKHFEAQGCAVLDSLLSVRMYGGTRKLRLRLEGMLGLWANDNLMLVVDRILNEHHHNLNVVQVQRRVFQRDKQIKQGYSVKGPNKAEIIH